MKFLEAVKHRPLIIDGSMGVLLSQKGLLKAGACPEELVLTNGEDIYDIHREYLNAGANIIETNTFGASSIKLEKYGLKDKTELINREAARLAKKAAEVAGGYVAGSIGPTGRFIKTEGDLPLEEAIEVFAQQAKALEQGGADVFIVETMFDLWELKAAIMGIKKVSKLPVIAQLTYQENLRTLTGTDPKTQAAVMNSLDVFATGVNCSMGPEKMLEIIHVLKKYSSCYVTAVPNAGLPVLIDGKTIFPMKADEFASKGIDLLKAGADIIGGCCGTDFSHIQALRKEINGMSRVKNPENKGFCLASRTKSFFLSESKFFLVGERLNPTARKKLGKAILDNNFMPYSEEAIQQVVKGADVIDVNTGVPDGDETILLPKAIGAVQGAVEAPISIDSSNPDAIIEALQICDGKPLINSINGKVETMEKLFPEMARHGASSIVLLMDEKGIPMTIQDRVKLIEKILTYSEKYGVKRENLIIDCLALALGAEPEGAMLALETIEKVTREYGLPTIMGISNVSYGLPLRKYMNSAFLSLCMAKGLKACIGNPMSAEYMAILNSSKYLLGHDNGKKYMDFASENKHLDNAKTKSKTEDKKTEIKKNSETESEKDVYSKLFNIVVAGRKEEVKNELENTLKIHDAEYIMKNILIPAIEKVGEKYDRQEFYLPQLMAGADAAKVGFELLKPLLKTESAEVKKHGVVYMATVEGDVHDIGKNIVSLMLDNFGFEVNDLGKDVKTDFLIEKLKNEKPDIIGLSALMTTTMSEMKIIIEKIKQANIDVKVMIGGAVVTKEYSDSIGADGWAADAMGAVIEAKKLMEKKSDCNQI